MIQLLIFTAKQHGWNISNVLVTQLDQGVNKEFASTRAEKIFEQLDEDGNGELSEEEFCRCADDLNGGEVDSEGLITQHSRAIC